MMKMYILDMATTVVVMADSPEHAAEVANDNRREIVSDSELEVRGTPALVTRENLRNEWDITCIPYGGDGNTRIAELLSDNVEATGEAKRSRIDQHVMPVTAKGTIWTTSKTTK